MKFSKFNETKYDTKSDYNKFMKVIHMVTDEEKKEIEKVMPKMLTERFEGKITKDDFRELIYTLGLIKLSRDHMSIYKHSEFMEKMRDWDKNHK